MSLKFVSLPSGAIIDCEKLQYVMPDVDGTYIANFDARGFSISKADRDYLCYILNRWDNNHCHHMGSD